MAEKNYNPYATQQRSITGVNAFATPDFNVDLLNYDRFLETQSGDKRKPVVYGATRTGGILVFQDLVGPNSDYLLQVYTVSEGEIHGITDVYANGSNIKNSMFTSTVQQNVTTIIKSHPFRIAEIIYDIKYKPFFDTIGAISGQQRTIYAQTSTGRSDYTSTSLPLAKLSSKWDDTFLGNGSASVAVLIDLSAFPSEPKLEFDIKGQLVNDIRTESNTKAWSTNPALCLLDYLTNSRYGGGKDLSDYDLNSFIEQANICDESINIKTGQNLQSNKSSTITISKRASETWGTVTNIGPSRFQTRTRTNLHRGHIINDGYDVVSFTANDSNESENIQRAKAFNKQIFNQTGYQLDNPILLINTLRYKSGSFSSGGDYYGYAILINANGEYVAAIATDANDVSVTVELAVKNKPVGDVEASPRFSFNGIIDQSETVEKNVLNMLAEMNASLYPYNGKQHLKCYIPSTVVKTFDLSNIIDDIEYEFGDSDTKYNGVQASYRDPNFGFTNQSVVAIDSSYDGGNSNSKEFKELNLNFCDSYGRAHYLASMFLNKSKLQDSIKFTCTHVGLQYEVGNIIRVNDTKNNINRVYSIVDKTPNSDLTVTLICLVYETGIFEVLQLDIPHDVTLPLTSTTIRTSLDPVTDFIATQVAFDVSGSVDLSWKASAAVDHFNVEYKTNGQYQLLAKTSDLSFRAVGLKAGAYTFRIRACNKLETLVSDYVSTTLNINTNTVVFPSVSNITGDFTSVSAVAKWDDLRNQAYVNDTNPLSVGNSTYRPFISGYEVRVYSGTSLRRTEVVSEPKYDYSLEKNSADGLKRSIKFVVRTINTMAQVGTATSTVTVVNNQMSAPVDVVVKTDFDTVYASTFKPTELDYNGTQFHMSKTKGFTPNSSTLVADVRSNTFSQSFGAGKWYCRIGHYDVFDALTINFSAEKEIVLTEVTLADIDVDGIIAGINESLQNEAVERARVDIQNAQDALLLVTQEASDRAAAIQAETVARTNAVAKEASDRATAITTAVASETAARTTAITTEATARANAINAEASARHDALIAEASARGTAISNEAKSRSDADSALSSRVDVISAATGSNAAAITAEATARTDADSALSTRVDSVLAKSNANSASISSEVTARANADSALSTRVDSVLAKSNANSASITSLTKTVTDNNSATATRIDTVEATALTQAANAETNAKSFATASVNTEKNARITADSALTTRIDTVTATADKNKADIVTVTTALTTKEAALAQSITNVQANVDGVDSKLTTEKTARTTADTALSGRIDTVTATANKNKADIVTVNTALADQNTAFASSLTTMETAVKADATTKANAAKASALVTAALDAKTKADKALADAKVDASSKASTAESNAKVAAAQDAANKANSALADAKAYANAKKAEATTYTDSKYTQAITLINQKDSAQSTKTSTLEAAIGYSLSEINNQETNWDFKRGNLNWEFGEVVNDPEVGKCLELTGNTWSTNHVFIPVDTARTYRMSVKIKQHVVNGSRYIYAGVRTYDANFQELTGGAGTYRYCAVSGVASKDVWTTYSGNITGTGSTAMSQFRDGTCYIKLMVIGNYSGGSGKCRFADLKFEDITEQLEVNAKITSVENAVATKDAAMTSRVNTMESSLSNTITTKANQAESNAKVAAAADAKAKADAALAAAKTDASSKASTAETNAKVAAATDAANKANSALANAKAYADAKKAEAATYTNSKITEVTNTLNTKDSAMASRVTSMESNVTRLNDNSEQQVQSDQIVNSRFTLKNKDNRPVGWFATYSSANPANIGYSSVDGNGAYLLSATDSSMGMCSTAFRVRDGVEYIIRIRVKAQVAKPNGFYFRIAEYDAELPRGKVAIGESTSEACVQQHTRQITSFRENQAITTEWVDFQWTYKPTVNAQYASALLLNWEGMGAGNPLYIDFVSIEAVVSKDYTDAKYNQAVSLINTKDAAQASRVTSMETSLKADSATKANKALADAKVAAAADAKAKADAALAAAKTDASSKASTAETNAKVAAATDAANKANSALANAKAYADAKKAEATTYTNAKFTDAINTINSKDSAMASRVVSMESSVSTLQQPAGLAYRKDITITGDANKYYPVYIKYGNQNYARRLVVQRAYSETAPNSWANSSTHKGGLLLDILGNWGGWGGQVLDWRIQELKQVYSTMYGGAGVTGHNMMFVVWLRGGGAVYHLASDQALDIQIGYSTNDVIRPDANPSYVVRALPAKTAAASAAEINSKLVSNKAYIGLDQVDNKSSATIVSEAAVYTNSKYEQAINTINSKDAAMTSRVTTMESTVKADATTKANQAEANAKSAAATFTTAKFNDAINTINSKDSARASQISTVEASVRKDFNTRGNLLQQYMSNWKLTKHPADCGMGINGASNENRFILGSDPYGSRSVLWEMNTNSATNSDGDGGIGAGYFTCDSKKSYRFSLYVKRSESGGIAHFGCGSATTQNLNGSKNANPYFWAAALPQNNKWYLIVGVLQADNGTIDSGLSGLYDCETGVKVSNGTDYRIASGATSQYLRAYLYYSTNPAAKQYFWAPRVDLIDGSEPSLTSLMPNIATNAFAKADAAQSYALAKFTEAVDLTTAKDSAMGTRVNSLTTTVGNNTASVNTLSTSVNGLKAEHTIKVNVNGHVAGIGLSSTGMSSAFIAQADRIVLANSAGGGGVAPFKLVNNIVYLNTAVIQNASITTAHVGQLEASNIKAGAINASHIAANTITGDKILAGTKISSPIIEGGQFRSIGPNTMKVESETAFGPDNLVEWRGPKLLLANGEPDWANLKKSNAKRWTDVNGDEYYGGSLSAGTLSQNISNVLLTFYTLNSYLNELGPFTSNGKPKNVIVSYNMSASHRNSAAVSSPTQPKLQWQLERSINNSAWVTVSSGTYNGVTEVEYDQESRKWDTSEYCSGSTTFTDNSTTVGSYSYRIKVLAYSRYHATQNVRSQRLTLISTEQ
ncbi:hypothetical protein [Shewanella sp.]|uniref:hypothetical protein n=1 Tax=Shewanella sp. TaxID=50422 RepID=UPI0040488D79